jgi:DGQHR domain-containing protein
MTLKIKGTRFKQNNIDFLVGVAKAKDILKQSSIDEWTQSNNQGYQREISKPRAREFGRFISNNGISPNAVLLNIRDVDMNEIKNTPGSEYDIPNNVKLWIVDGQHRLKGIEIIGESDPKILDLEIPVVIMGLKGDTPENARYKEAIQFLIINRTQKGVRSDLAERILVKVSEMEGVEQVMRNTSDQILPSSLSRDLTWKPRAVHISDLLNKRQDSPLKGKIKLPNTRTRGTTVSQVSVVSSLKQLLQTSPFMDLSDDMLASVLINLWKAVQKLCPEPFEEVEEIYRAKDYVLLKTTGIFVIPQLLLRLLPYCPRKDGKPVLTLEAFKNLLERAGDLMQTSFWRSTGDGTAGSIGTGQKSFTSIANLIIKRITSGENKQRENIDVII